MTNVVPVRPRGTGVPAKEGFRPESTPSPVTALPYPAPAGELGAEHAVHGVFGCKTKALAGGWQLQLRCRSQASAQEGIIFTNRVFSISKAFGEADYLEISADFFFLRSLTWLGSLIFCKILQFYFRVEISYEIQMYFMIHFCCQLFYF